MTIGGVPFVSIRGLDVVDFCDVSSLLTRRRKMKILADTKTASPQTGPGMAIGGVRLAWEPYGLSVKPKQMATDYSRQLVLSV